MAKGIAAEAPWGSLAEVARILDYPVKKLVAKDLTDNFRIKFGDEILSAHEYSSRDNTFVPITVTVARQGVLLTPELRVQLKRNLQTSLSGDVRLSRKLKSLKLANSVDGFVGVEGFGSSRGRWHLVLTLPQRGLDLHMSAAAAPSEMLLDVEPGTLRYYERACAGGEEWWDKLTAASQQGIEYLLRDPRRAPTRPVAVDPAQVSGDARTWENSTFASLQTLRIAIEGGPSRWLLMGTCAWLIIGVLAARVGIYGK